MVDDFGLLLVSEEVEKGGRRREDEFILSMVLIYGDPPRFALVQGSNHSLSFLLSISITESTLHDWQRTRTGPPPSSELIEIIVCQSVSLFSLFQPFAKDSDTLLVKG